MSCMNRAGGMRMAAFLPAAIFTLVFGMADIDPAIADPKLVAHVEAITAKLAGRTGFAAQLLGDDTVISLNGDETFPMASTYKVAIAGKVLAMVDAGELSLDRMVEVPPESYVPSPAIAANFIHPGVSLSVANLIEVMIVHSDNTATDLLMALAGGPAAITAWLRELGIETMRIDRPTAELLHDVYPFFRPGLAAMLEDTDDDDDEDPNDPAIPAFEADPRDQTTPDAMLRLLVLLAEGDVLKPETRDFLLAVMSRTVTGLARIRGLLPPGTPVEDKTGTIGGVANDVGFVTLPDGRRFAVAIYTKSSTTPPAARERAVAETARILYDYYALR